MDDRIKVEVEFFADIVCPWCLVGKRRLEQAAASHGGVELGLRWRSFLLNPQMQPGGMERRKYLDAKFGGAAGDMYERITAAGSDAGVEFRFKAIARIPDSRPAHSLIQAAGASAGAVIEDLFKSYFTDGLDIGSDAVLAGIAARHGIPFPTGDRHAGEVVRDLEAAGRLGIQGVPFFVFGGGMAISGAHPPETFLPILDAAIAAASPA